MKNRSDINRMASMMGKVKNGLHMIGEGGKLSEAKKKELKKEYSILKDEHERGRQAIGTNDKKTLNQMRLTKPYNNNDLNKTLSELERVRKKLGYGVVEEASFMFPHVGQQIRGTVNAVSYTHLTLPTTPYV